MQSRTIPYARTYMCNVGHRVERVDGAACVGLGVPAARQQVRRVDIIRNVGELDVELWEDDVVLDVAAVVACFY